MKYILIIFIVGFPIAGNTQSGIGYIELKDDFQRSVIGITFNEKDSSFAIIGDTLEVLKMLFWRARQRDKHEQELWKTVEAGVKYANSIPDYYKIGRGGK